MCICNTYMGMCVYIWCVCVQDRRDAYTFIYSHIYVCVCVYGVCVRARKRERDAHTFIYSLLLGKIKDTDMKKMLLKIPLFKDGHC